MVPAFSTFSVKLDTCLGAVTEQNVGGRFEAAGGKVVEGGTLDTVTPDDREEYPHIVGVAVMEGPSTISLEDDEVDTSSTKVPSSGKKSVSFRSSLSHTSEGFTLNTRRSFSVVSWLTRISCVLPSRCRVTFLALAMVIKTKLLALDL